MRWIFISTVSYFDMLQLRTQDLPVVDLMKLNANAQETRFRTRWLERDNDTGDMKTAQAPSSQK
jgi:hypothetical protein